MNGAFLELPQIRGRVIAENLFVTHPVFSPYRPSSSNTYDTRSTTSTTTGTLTATGSGLHDRPNDANRSCIPHAADSSVRNVHSPDFAKTYSPLSDCEEGETLSFEALEMSGPEEVERIYNSLGEEKAQLGYCLPPDIIRAVEILKKEEEKAQKHPCAGIADQRKSHFRPDIAKSITIDLVNTKLSKTPAHLPVNRWRKDKESKLRASSSVGLTHESSDPEALRDIPRPSRLRPEASMSEERFIADGFHESTLLPATTKPSHPKLRPSSRSSYTFSSSFLNTRTSSPQYKTRPSTRASTMLSYRPTEDELVGVRVVGPQRESEFIDMIGHDPFSRAVEREWYEKPTGREVRSRPSTHHQRRFHQKLREESTKTLQSVSAALERSLEKAVRFDQPSAWDVGVRFGKEIDEKRCVSPSKQGAALGVKYGDNEAKKRLTWLQWRSEGEGEGDEVDRSRSPSPAPLPSSPQKLQVTKITFPA